MDGFGKEEENIYSSGAALTWDIDLMEFLRASPLHNYIIVDT